MLSPPTDTHDTDAFRFSLRATAGFIITIALLIASAGIPAGVIPAPTIAQRALVFLGICLGPVSGWILALGQGGIAGALPMLTIMSALCTGPFIIALVLRSSGAIMVSAILWLISGYVFSIAVGA